MKKILAVLTVVTVLSIGAIAFAHGSGYGGHMGSGYGNNMMGRAGGYDQKFLDETADVRKELHQKKFEYMEAVRDPKPGEKTVAKLEKEITDLQENLYAKAPRTARGFGYGPCWQ